MTRSSEPLQVQWMVPFPPSLPPQKKGQTFFETQLFCYSTVTGYSLAEVKANGEYHHLHVVMYTPTF